jgi:tRNA nucleotidyltransferase (CCA-adding enzyme)
MEWFRERVRALDVAVRPPEPLLKGRDLLELGLEPGPRMGELLREVYEKQLDGAVTSVDEARALASRLVAGAKSASGETASGRR